MEAQFKINHGPVQEEPPLSYEELKQQRFKYKIILITDIFKCLELLCCPMMKETPLWYNTQFDLLIDQHTGELENVLLNCQQKVREKYQLWN